MQATGQQYPRCTPPLTQIPMHYTECGDQQNPRHILVDNGPPKKSVLFYHGGSSNLMPFIKSNPVLPTIMTPFIFTNNHPLITRHRIHQFNKRLNLTATRTILLPRLTDTLLGHQPLLRHGKPVKLVVLPFTPKSTLTRTSPCKSTGISTNPSAIRSLKSCTTSLSDQCRPIAEFAVLPGTVSVPKPVKLSGFPPMTRSGPCRASWWESMSLACGLA